MQLFSRLSKFFIALLSRKRAAKRRHRDSRFKQSFAFRSLCFRRCCLYAANSGTGQLAVRVYRATLLSQRSNMLRSFSSFAANNNSRSYSAVFRRLLLQWKATAEVIRRQGRKFVPASVTQACLQVTQRAQPNLVKQKAALRRRREHVEQCAGKPETCLSAASR